MLQHLILLNLIFGVHFATALEVNIPPDWTHTPVPSELPSSIKSLVKVLSPEGDAEVSISEMEITKSLDESVTGFVEGAAKGGFQHDSTTSQSLHGYQSRHVSGTFAIPNGGGELSCEAYLVQTQDAIVSIGVTGLNTSARMDEVIGWIRFPAVDEPQSRRIEAIRTHRSFWEYLGMGVVYAAIAYAIINAKRSKKIKKGEQDVAPNP